MAATIEALLEENLGKVQELLQTSETLQNNLNEHLAPLDDAINNTVVPAVSSSLERMKAINEALPKLQQAFDQAEQEADTKLGEIDKQLDEVTQNVTKTEQSTDELLDQLETEFKQIHRSVETHEASIGDELENMELVTSDFIEVIEARSKEVTTAIDMYSGKVKEAFETIDQHKGTIVEQLNTIDEQRNIQIADVAGKWDQAIAGSKEKVEATITELDSKASASLTKLANLYSEQLPGEIDNYASSLAELIGMMGKGSQQVLSKAEQEVETAAESIDDILEVLQTCESAVNNILDSV
jgi:uncharacterized membrane-anchored protein YhcB (DUF1043 family)